MALNDPFGNNKRFSVAVERLKTRNMHGSNRQTSLGFVNYCLTIGMSKVRLLRYMHLLRKLDEQLCKDFKDADLNDIRAVVGEIQQNELYKPWTRYTYKACLKRFYKYLNGDKEYPETVNWIKCVIKKNEVNLPNDGELIIEEEVKTLLDAARHPRDKLSLAYCGKADAGLVRLQS